MVFLRSLLRTNRRIGLAFVHDQGLDLQVYSYRDNNTHWQRFVSFADIESHRQTAHPDIPKTAGWTLVIPGYQCTTRCVILPSTDQLEIEKMLEFELPNIVPYNTQAWAWDFSIIGQGEGGKSKILVLLSPLSLIDRHIKTLSTLGIKPDVITTSAMLHTLLLSTEKPVHDLNPMGCFCLDDDCMDFCVIENRQVTFLRGIRFTKKSFEDRGLVEAEIQRSLSMIKEHGSASYPNRFLAINANNSIADFVKIIGKIPGISFEDIELAALYKNGPLILDRLVTVSSDNYLSSAPEKVQINLLPRHLKEKHRRTNKRRQTILHALKVGVVLLLAFLCLKTSIWRKSRLLQHYESRLSAISPMAEKLQLLQQQLTIIENQLQGNVSTLQIVSELYRVLPEDISVHYLSIEQNKKVIIRAQARLLSQAFDCIGPLEQSDYFANVRQSYANQRQIENSVLIDFEIVADLQKPGKGKDRK